MEDLQSEVIPRSPFYSSFENHSFLCQYSAAVVSTASTVYYICRKKAIENLNIFDFYSFLAFWS